MRLADFRAGLKASLKNHPVARPFVCDGSPLKCDLFVVGTNPAHDGKFWHYWDDDHGYDYQTWFKDYLHVNRLDGARQRLFGLRVALGSHGPRLLETNVVAMPTPRRRDLKEFRTDPFAYLLREIKPTVILAHGKDAHTYMHTAGAFVREIDENRCVRDFGTHKAVVIENRHFVNERLDYLPTLAQLLVQSPELL